MPKPRISLTRGLLVVALFSIALNLLVLTTPLYMLQVYDRVLATQSLDTLKFLTIIALVAVAAYAGLDAVRQSIMTGLARWWEENVRPTIFLSALAKARSGNRLGGSIYGDVSTVRAFLTGPSIAPIFDGPWVPFFITAIWLLHPWLGLTAIGAALLLLALAVINDLTTRKPLRKAALLTQRGDAHANQFLHSSDSVLAMGMGPTLVERQTQFHEEQISAFSIANNRSALVTGISRGVRIAVQIGILGIGAMLVIRNELSAGGMIAASIILGRALAPLEQLIGAWRQLINMRDARQRLRTLIDEADDDSLLHLSLPEPRGAIRIEDLTYAPAGTTRPIIDNVSMSIEPGEAIAIVGPSGSGKSTLCKLIVGAIVPGSGRVSLDGATLDQWSPRQFGKAVGYVSQSTELFAGTIAQNIARFEDAADATIIEAAKTAGCHDMILGLPKGYNSDIGDFGGFLSGGQRQRIALARAVYCKPRVVVFDEANAFLDVDGEFAFLKAIDFLKRHHSTIILVTHRTALLKPIDKVAILRGGRLVAFGDRDRVLRDLNPVRQVPDEKGAATGAHKEAS